MTVIDWTLLRSIKVDLNVENADESNLQRIEDAADELNKIESADEFDEVSDLQTLFAVSQKIIKLKTLQAEAAIEELETSVRNSSLAQENEKLRRDLARAKRADDQSDQLSKAQEELDQLELALKREKQNGSKFESLYNEADRDRKSLQVEILALQSELEEKVKDVQKYEKNAEGQYSEKQYIVKLKEKNDQITKLMLALQEEENLNEDLRSTIEQLGAKLRDATVEINQSADLIEELREVNDRLHDEVKQNKKEITNLEGLVDKYMDKINEFEAIQPPDLDPSTSRNSSGDRLDTWRGILESKNSQIHELENKTAKLERELESLLSSSSKLTLDVLKKAIAEKDEQIKNLAESLTQATLDIEDNTRIIESLREELASKSSQGRQGKEVMDRLHKLENENSELEKQLLDREEQLADALLVSRKYEMGVYGLSDAVTEVRVCKRKIATRDKNILRLQEQVAECYVEIERLTKENENLCQGILPTARKVNVEKNDSVEAEKTILALEEEILDLKQSLRELQKNLVDQVHKVSSEWNSTIDTEEPQKQPTSSDEENFDRCQISQISCKKQDSLDTTLDAPFRVSEVEVENQQLKEFLLQILEVLQKINSQKKVDGIRNVKEKIAKQPRDTMKPIKEEVITRAAPPTPVKRKTVTKKIDEINIHLLKEFVKELSDENKRLAADVEELRTKVPIDEASSLAKMFESSQKQLLSQRTLISFFSGVLIEQLTYIDSIQEVYNRQIRAIDGKKASLSKPNIQYQIDFDQVGELKKQIKLMNDDIIVIKKNIRNSEAGMAVATYEEQAENLFIIEKLKVQNDILSKQCLKAQKTIVERESELLQILGKQEKSEEAKSRSTSDTITENDSDDEEVSQTESEQSVSQSFFRKMDSLRDYNRKLCSELVEARYVLKRSQDALKIKDTLLKEVNRQHTDYGSLDQKLKVMQISLDTAKELLGHKEQTLDRYRQLVTDLKQKLVAVKVKCNADIQSSEKKHMNEMYQARKQIAEITMKNVHSQQLALNDASPGQMSFETILADKQVQIVQLQNKVKSMVKDEVALRDQLEQSNAVNQKLRDHISDLQDKLTTAERLNLRVTPVPEIPKIITTPIIPQTGVDLDETKNSDEDDEQTNYIEELQEKLEHAEQKILRFKQSAETHKEKITELQNEIEQQNAKIEQLRKIQSLKRTDPKRMRGMEDEIEKLRQQLYELKHHQAEKPLEDTEKSVKQNVELARWEESKKWQSVLEALKEQLKTKVAAIEQLEGQRATLKSQIIRLEKEKYKLQDRIKASATMETANTQTIDTLQKRIQILERTVTCLQGNSQKAKKKLKDNKIVPILVSPKSPRKRRGPLNVSFDASVVDNEALSEAEDDLVNEPIPSALSKL